jgi:hypothetical protein
MQVPGRRLATYARQATANGQELVDFMLQVMRGEPLPLKASRARRARYPQTPKIEHRLLAAQWLADRGWGRARELIELTGDSVTTPEQRLALLRQLSDEDRATLRQLLARAIAAAPIQAPAPVDLEPAGAPEDLGRPRNVARAIAPELQAPESPAESPQAPANGAPPETGATVS